MCSGPNTDLVERLGAEAVLDYATTDFTRAGTAYDLVFDIAGKSSFTRNRKVLRRGGMYLTTAPSLAILLQMVWTSRFGSRRAMVAFTGMRDAAKRADLSYLAGLAAAGALAPVVDTCYPLGDITDAYRHVDRGHKRGNVIVTMTD